MRTRIDLEIWGLKYLSTSDGRTNIGDFGESQGIWMIKVCLDSFFSNIKLCF